MKDYDIIKIHFEEYVQSNNKCEVHDYFKNLKKYNGKIYRKFVARLYVMECHDLIFSIRPQWVRSIKHHKKMYEVKFKLGHDQERIIYCKLVNNTCLMLYGFTKTSTKKQRRKIKCAAKLQREAKRRFDKYGIHEIIRQRNTGYDF